ncbi:O-antigen ligase [Tessaracoccus sp. OH4464_COT-324]|uniref:O-antigen ligase family protein n=1 Tax=Tessaracoccus sp. OH4464_COT-324 TaxID=2491059 RepID=UPI000F6353C6|nr:O-antigen ligase family protein [Tessaracoccus sp. OH4464_COT-324]RRD46171.1 hypothetical protein EII42_08265 [Tessaracoccus sp. OH4464_COT-324]
MRERTIPVRSTRLVGGEFFLAFMSLAVILQFPGNTFLALGLPILALLWNGIQRHYLPRPWVGGVAVAWLAVSSVAALFALAKFDVLLDRNYFLLFVSLLVTALVLTMGQNRPVVASLARWIYISFLLLTIIGVAEVLTGFKLVFIRYPDTTVWWWVANYRWITTAVYANYNDFSVAIAVFALFLLARMLLAPKAVPTQLLRGLSVLTIAVWILAMGSRGALLGLVVGAAVLLFIAARARDSRAFPPWLIVTGASLSLLGATVLAQSSYIQDGDTAARFRIISRIWSLLSEDPAKALTGFGSPEVLQKLAENRLENQLVNPHNMLVEALLWGGFPALTGLLILWALVVWFSLTNRIEKNWYAMASAAFTVAMPVFGLAPSVFLHYLYPQLIMLVAACSVSPRRPAAEARDGDREPTMPR